MRLILEESAPFCLAFCHRVGMDCTTKAALTHAEGAPHQDAGKSKSGVCSEPGAGQKVEPWGHEECVYFFWVSPPPDVPFSLLFIFHYSDMAL